MTFSDARRRAMSETNKTGKHMFVYVRVEGDAAYYEVTSDNTKDGVIVGHSKVSFDGSMNTRVVFVESRLGVANHD